MENINVRLHLVKVFKKQRETVISPGNLRNTKI